MKLIKIVQALLPVLSQLVRDLSDDGKVDAVERDALIVACGLKIAEILAIVMAPKEEPAE